MPSYLRRYLSLFSTTLSSSIGIGTGETITLASVTNLPTSTEITITIDRVDSSGTATPSKMERITGTLSGNNLTSYTRAIDNSTEQAHSAGAVIEMVWNATDWNSLVSGFLVGHSQTGSHAASSIVAGNLAASSVSAGNLNFTAGDVTLTGSETLTNKTIGTTNLISFNSPQGFLINGKIVPSVAANDLTVAIKGRDGNDPSATNPVYCRIGDTIRSITAALSVTKNDGTNWFNAGSAELATKEIDYFVYLGYNATDGVVIGFARIPYAAIYSDFSATTTNEKYAAISTIANASAGDYYEVIGRFAATLSATAAFTWTVPTFTAINLIQRPIYDTRWLAWAGVFSGSGAMTIASIESQDLRYRMRGREIALNAGYSFTTAGTSNAYFSITLPFTMVGYNYQALGIGQTNDGEKNYAVRYNGNTYNQIGLNKDANAVWSIGAITLNGFTAQCQI